jgi:hypothetical protein
MTEVPLTTLLSWAWVAFTIEVDNAVEAEGADRTGRLFRISIAMWANGLRCIGEDGITVDELRAQARAACNIGGLERWGWITVGDPADQRLRAGLEAIVSQREVLAEGLRPPGGCWRAAKPYLAQTQRVLADPTAALPWQPMVLHRGGWPDGA